MSNDSSLKPDSHLVAAGRQSDISAPLNVPIVPASNYILGGDLGYSRDDATPTWQALETIVGGLENAHCVSYASGMAAISAIFDQLMVDSVIVLPDDCYQGVVGLAEQGQERGFWRVIRLPVEATAEWLDACLNADLIWLESPSNPLLKVAELDIICSAPRKSGSLLAVDNTLATALNQRPLDMGADLVVQSGTKFIGGHSDLLSGIVTTQRKALYDNLRTSRSLNGATPGNLEAFLATRGCRTLALRLERAQQSAMAIATWLEAHPNVTRVRYPGLPSHTTHVVAKRIMYHFGSLISFDLSANAEQTDAFCRAVKLIRHATSLGSVESTMERRAAVPGQTHLPASMLRMCVGIENPEDLIQDLEQAFQAIT